MLSRRLATAFVFILPFLLGILTERPGHLVLWAMAAGCSVWGLSEFFNLASRLGANVPRSWVYFLCVLLPGLVYARYGLGWSLEWLLLAVALGALGVLAGLVCRGEVGRAWISFLVSFAGPVYVLGPILLIQVFHQCREGFWFILFVFLTTWISDTGAYFGGRSFGRRKLAPKISPGKTVEGLVAGMVLSILSILAAGGIQMGFSASRGFFWTGGAVADILRLCMLNVGLVLTGNLGDLAESMLKRNAGVKDSGSGLTGHGGFLDIMDSLLVNIPLLFVWALVFEDLQLS